MPERSAKEHRQQMERLLEGYVQTQLLYVAAKLGLADLMTEGPKSSEELATITATHPLALSLLLRSLAEMGIFAQDEEGRLLVDLGGGYGGLLAAILQAHPSLHGIVFDLPGLREGAERLLQDEGVATRCSFVGGSLLEAVPRGGDAYLLLRTLRNLDDRSVLLALRNCREAMDRVAALLIIERLRGVADGCPPTSLALLIEGSGAHDRTEADHSTLLQAAGFRLGSILPTASGLSILEAVPDL